MIVLSNSQLIEIIIITNNQLNRYFPLFIFLFGIIGNLLNIIILSQRTLRRNSCIYLFLLSSISNLFSILFGLIPKILSGWNINLIDNNIYYCKFYNFIIFTSRTIAFWLIMLATINRWILSSFNVHRRRLSTLKNSQYASLIIVLCSLFLYLHIFYCYQINLLHTPFKCFSKTISCRLYTDIIYACFTILFPLISMIIFGLITISNIRKKHYSQNSYQNYTIIPKKRWKKLDQYLYRILFLQIILLICLTLPEIIFQLYLILTLNQEKSQIQTIIENFFYNFCSFLPFIESAIPFYVYTLTGGKIFRSTLKKLFWK